MKGTGIIVQRHLFGEPAPIRRWATFSSCAEHEHGRCREACVCRPYRYDLGRVWDEGRPVMLAILLNPSTADADHDDPTVAKCGEWARAWGYGGLVVCNLFAFRATDPRVMKAASATVDPIGPDNDTTIERWTAAAGLVVCGWGENAAPNAAGWPKGSVHRARAGVVARRLAARLQLHALTVTSSGEPGHPLYLAKATRPQEWWPPPGGCDGKEPLSRISPVRR